MLLCSIHMYSITIILTQQNCNCNYLWLCENTKHFPISNCFDSHVKQSISKPMGAFWKEEARLQLVYYINIYISIFVCIYKRELSLPSFPVAKLALEESIQP